MRTIALDTETTGTDFNGEARPFYISTCDDDGLVNQRSLRQGVQQEANL